ncbi:uncharacterized protein ARMOST_19624 [Armillaria ostoyae]|uniref:Uncharacterized protein n=1 Tax=Armillaria ostoyae TaxID=47428 RepID=A0A284S568_ARMOS|nr:uncharacterized protein ARMOST_19624 [Armillaria ostoyae]
METLLVDIAGTPISALKAKGSPPHTSSQSIYPAPAYPTITSRETANEQASDPFIRECATLVVALHSTAELNIERAGLGLHEPAVFQTAREANGIDMLLTPWDGEGLGFTRVRQEESGLGN